MLLRHDGTQLALSQNICNPNTRIAKFPTCPRCKRRTACRGRGEGRVVYQLTVLYYSIDILFIYAVKHIDYTNILIR